jgi:hypothetical protein
MIKALIEVLNQNLFAMGLIFILWVILFDNKAMERVRKPAIKKFLYFTIILYYGSILLQFMFLLIGVSFS